MIRPLRRRHPWLVAVIALIVAPLYLAALASRPEPALQEELAGGLAEPGSAASGETVELSTTPPLQVRSAGTGAIEVRADGFVDGADLLLYWAPAAGSRSLADAWLLDAVRGGERQRLDLPDAAAGAAGVLVLYSLGHGEEIAYASWPPGSAP